jgi:hypothetical protein
MVPTKSAGFLFSLVLFLSGFSGLPAAEGREEWPVLMGTSRGLYGMDRFGITAPVWSGGKVLKILRSGSSWLLLSDEGILVSQDLLCWEKRNRGLPVKTLKIYKNGEVSFTVVIQEIKDLAVHPENPNILVCATADRVFLSVNEGRSWEDLGMPGYRSNGIKAVAAANLPGLTVFLSHALYGVHYRTPGTARWIPLNEGLEELETTDYPDEVSDIAAAPGERGLDEVFVSQTFRGKVYRLDWGRKRFDDLWPDSSGAADSLDIGKEAIRFVREKAVAELSRRPPGGLRSRPDIQRCIETFQAACGLDPASLWVRENSFLRNPESITLSELWLLDPGDSAPREEEKRGLYLPVHHAVKSATLKPYLDLIGNRGLNMLVIDMKDDYGRLRFTPRNPEITARATVFEPVDIDGFLREAKSRGIYTTARIVAFKDPELAKKEGGAFALWDAKTNKPWAGYRTAPEGPDAPKIYYDEQWVDLYSEKVWDYIAGIAEELYERGFDEIQLDYIRFPTDGENLSDALYRWKAPGMDRESALLSFLGHIRSRFTGPLSIDIYGANGWYRTGSRTGQEVELLAPYADVICPMYYPSHFGQDFLAQAPAELRPYRIYYQGVRRARWISRGRAVIRPYIQAFYLDVSYDREYYNRNYVRRETDGVRDAGRGGYTYWNNSGRYGDIPAAP